MNELITTVIENRSVYLEAIQLTLIASVLSILLALALGLIIALLHSSPIKVVRFFTRTYISFFRGTPLLLQLLILYVGLTGFVQLSGMQALILGLGLHFAAYISEAFRAAINSVDQGQVEASVALGIPRGKRFKDIIFPQALSRAIPPVSNSVIDIIKSTSLGSVIAVQELTYVSDQIAATTYLVMPLLLFSASVYWILSTLIQAGQHKLEQRYAIR